MVAVGDSAEVELIFTSSKGHGGPVSKSATVTCNDNDRGNFQLSLKGKTYEKPDSLTPLTLSATVMTWDQQTKSKEAKVVVKNVSKNSLKMHLVSQPYGYLKISLPDGDIKPGKEKEIKVRIDSSVKDVDFKKSFTFAVDDSAGTRYTVPTILAKPVIAPPIQSAPANKVVAPDTTKKTGK
ncbi:MAG: DUF1573 domain-containing protein [Candidatus Zixiibacteriota bacterium]|nr:MAG: DUF1573 domain-containing protein [candidate division Zixibacteria bacterium]